MDPLWIIVGFLGGNVLAWIALFLFDTQIFAVMDKIYYGLPWHPRR